MKPIFYLIPVLTILIILGITLSTEAQSPPTHFASVKAVFQFEHTANQGAVQDVYVTSIKPQAVTIIDTYSSNVDDFSYVIRNDDEVLYIIGFNDVTGKNIYEFYPKIIFFGTLPDGVTKAQFDTKFNTFLDDIKDMIITTMTTNGATDITFHIHYTTGSIDG